MHKYLLHIQRNRYLPLTSQRFLATGVINNNFTLYLEVDIPIAIGNVYKMYLRHYLYLWLYILCIHTQCMYSVYLWLYLFIPNVCPTRNLLKNDVIRYSPVPVVRLAFTIQKVM